ncbi:DUF4230 domain-containing protein [Sporosarcina sp. Marseille-Q4063]|uniref:DUF4230 domain-containing protein n=1 Tax=Sporosarcina sp. Marseille-Q4063 TaxID=2810514 RepID=UPI001BB09580|nr:DUF4230 domain-containing protein [Sporosarcina sp. Marseille-Q4063]QUW21104.1 DUF4230 domain-containing protein [Sporosarcina sp. Marseille-Q4063]
MSNNKKTDEIERLLKELKASEEETAVTVEETRNSQSGFWGVGKLFFSVWKKSILIIALLILTLMIALPFATFYFLKTGSTFTEEKGVFLERIIDINELATAEAYSKAIIKREDNKILGKDIGMNLAGTKRQLLVVVPGSVKAGVDLSGISNDDFIFNESKKTAKLTLPHATFLSDPVVFLDKADIYSLEGLFRGKANIEEGFEIAEEAKELILKDATEQGVLQRAEKNAEKTLREMFSFAGYDVTIEFKE